MALPYVSGNWTFSSLHTDSVSTAKTISLPDVRPAVEYTASTTPLGKAKPELDQVIYHTDGTGSGMQAVGSFFLGTKRLVNIYDGTSIPTAERIPHNGGQKAMLSDVVFYQAINSVNGNTVTFPMKGVITVSVPSWSAVPVDVLYDYLTHLFGKAYAGANVVTPQTFAGALRGDLDLTK